MATAAALRAATTGVDMTVVRRSGMTAAATTAMTAALRAATTVVDIAATTAVLRVVTIEASVVLRVVMIVVGTTVRRSAKSVAGTAGMSAVRLGVMTVAPLLGVMTVGLLVVMTVGLLGPDIRVGLGLGRLGMGVRPGSRAASGLGRAVMTAPVLHRGVTSGPVTKVRLRGGTIGPGTRVRLLEVTTVDRVAMTGPGRGARSAVAAGTIASAVVVELGVRTRRESVRARTTRSFRPASPVRSSTVG